MVAKSIKRIILAFSLSLILLISSSSMTLAKDYSNVRKIEDAADIFSSATDVKAEERLNDLYNKTKIPVFIVTEKEAFSGRVVDHADDLLRRRVGIDNDGVLLLVNMATRDVYISTSGRAIDLTLEKKSNAKIEALLDEAVYALQNDYNTLPFKFANKLERYLVGNTIDIKDIGISGLSGIATFILSFLGIKAGSSSKYSNLQYSLLSNSISSYDAKADRFIKKDVTTRYIAPPPKSSSSGGSGGSFTHKSSGGGTFGGGGRKF